MDINILCRSSECGGKRWRNCENKKGLGQLVRFRIDSSRIILMYFHSLSIRVGFIFLAFDANSIV